MADRKEKNVRNAKTEVIDQLPENLFSGSFDLDSVDWGAVARSYKILRLRSGNPDTFKNNEKLWEDYNRWIAMRMKTIEFDIALRMHFDEAIDVQNILSHGGDTSLKSTIVPLIGGLESEKIIAEI